MRRRTYRARHWEPPRSLACWPARSSPSVAVPRWPRVRSATQGYTIGNGSVSGATASAEPDTAGATADYTVGFTTPSALTKGSSTVTLSAPNGRTTFPAAEHRLLRGRQLEPLGQPARGERRLWGPAATAWPWACPPRWPPRARCRSISKASRTRPPRALQLGHIDLGQPFPGQYGHLPDRDRFLAAGLQPGGGTPARGRAGHLHHRGLQGRLVPGGGGKHHVELGREPRGQPTTSPSRPRRRPTR